MHFKLLAILTLSTPVFAGCSHAGTRHAVAAAAETGLGAIVTDTGPEATGEVYVRSAAVFGDYYKQHDKFEEDHRDGFQTVGDIAYRDDEGFIFICDRKKDMIISGGMNIYPAEIEAALESHPEI